MMKQVEPSSPPTRQVPRWLNFIFGGTSAMTATFIVQPMDLLKTRMQLLGLTGGKESTLQVAMRIIAREGFRGFYVGISAALLRQATYGTARLGCFNSVMDVYTKLFVSMYGQPGYGTKLGIGMFAGGVGGFVGTPADVALIRMSADGRLPFEQRRNYQNVFHALTSFDQPTQGATHAHGQLRGPVIQNTITREEGAMTLWQGCAATVTRGAIVNGVVLGTYAQARQLLLPALGESIILYICSSMIAGFAATVVSLPVDTIKTRVQNAERGTSQLTVIKSLLKNEGFLSLFSGLLPTYGKVGPHAMITFLCLEQINALYFRLVEFHVTTKLR